MGRNSRNRHWRPGQGGGRGGPTDSSRDRRRPQSPSSFDRRRSPLPADSGSRRKMDDVYIPTSPRGERPSHATGSDHNRGRRGRDRSEERQRSISPRRDDREDRRGDNSNNNREESRANRPLSRKRRHRSPKRRRSPSSPHYNDHKHNKKSRRDRSPLPRRHSPDGRRASPDTHQRRSRERSPLPQSRDDFSPPPRRDNNASPPSPPPSHPNITQHSPSQPAASGNSPSNISRPRSPLPPPTRRRSPLPNQPPTGPSGSRRKSPPPRNRPRRNRRDRRRKQSPVRRRPSPVRSERSLSPRGRSLSPLRSNTNRDPSPNRDPVDQPPSSPNKDPRIEDAPKGPKSAQLPRPPASAASSSSRQNKEGNRPLRSPRRSLSPPFSDRRRSDSSAQGQRRGSEARPTSPRGGNANRGGGFGKKQDGEPPRGPKGKRNKKRKGDFHRRGDDQRRRSPPRPRFTGANDVPLGPAHHGLSSGNDNKIGPGFDRDYDDSQRRPSTSGRSNSPDTRDDSIGNRNNQQQQQQDDRGNRQRDRRSSFHDMPPPPKPERGDGLSGFSKPPPRAPANMLDAPSKPVGGDERKGRISFSMNRPGKHRGGPGNRSESRGSRDDSSNHSRRSNEGPSDRKENSMSRPPAPKKLALQYDKTSAYKKLTLVGEGTYGKVYKAENKGTKQIVALKRCRLEGERDGFPITAIREMRILQQLRGHPNVVDLLETMVEHNLFYMVFEYMDHDLTGILNHPTFTLEPGHIKYFAKQFFEGLDFLHRRGVLHRDIKGSNILIDNNARLTLADFGLARFYDKKKKGLDYTNRVVTLWYRPPELLLGATEYDSSIDMWSAGCVFMEMFTKKAVFPGRDEVGQLDAIYKIMGTPNKHVWPGFTDVPWYHLIMYTKPRPPTFDEIYKSVLPEDAFKLIKWLLQYDPDKRPSASDVLKDAYFTNGLDAVAPLMTRDLKGDWHEYETKARRGRRGDRRDQRDQQQRQGN